MPGHADSGTLPEGVDTVFYGVVSGIGRASFDGVPDSTKTIVVKIIDVELKVEAVPLAEGDPVTVLVKRVADFHIGDTAVFYTVGWIIGNGVAVKEVSHVRYKKPGQPSKLAAASHVSKQLAKTEDSDLLTLTKSARFIFQGPVMSIAPEPAQLSKELTIPPTSDETEGYESEHEPGWHYALIRVENVIKGNAVQTEVLVRFASSPDVAWIGAPKLSVGERATFLFTSQEATTLNKGTALYTATEPGNVLSTEDGYRIKKLLQAVKPAR